MNKATIILSYFISFAVIIFFLIIILNPFHIKDKVIQDIAMHYFKNKVLSNPTKLELLKNGLNCDTKTNSFENYVPLSEKQKKQLKDSGIIINNIEDEITPEVKECVITNLKQERIIELLDGKAPTEKELKTIKNCVQNSI